MTIFEVKPEDIFRLNDTDLRTLIGYLSVQELREQQISASGVTFGGHQNAKDGGIDVRVDVRNLANIGYIPRGQTGFQVKAEDMPAGEIIKEMRPDGKLRASIEKLISGFGSYIIVSSKGATSDSALNQRRDAMRSALHDQIQSNNLHVDFYDRQRVASWVNSHPGLIPWVHARVGTPLKGWRPFSDWSSAPDSLSDEYLIDDTVRLIGGASQNGQAASVVDGINHMRSALRVPGGVVRLVGLSGVGKTRLVQALFDEKIGTLSLSPHDAVYTDLADGPEPQPQELVQRLKDLCQNCILIIDNCGIALHQKLASRPKDAPNKISIITVEYDVTDDEAEGTEVFRLEPASVDLIEKVISRKYPGLSEPEIRTIAKFSEGNSRIALALAQTTKNGESVANLKDSELFKRLFRQNNENDPLLLRAAKAMSLVYSFDGEILEGAESEITILANLANQSVNEMHAHIAELSRRQLVQQRSKWRALLPHALSHRLAKEALQDFPRGAIMKAIEDQAPQRMTRSFTRRIGYLHDSKEAQAIVAEWLKDGGHLANVEDLDEFRLALFDNISPVNIPSTMCAIEKATDRIKNNRSNLYTIHKIIQISRSIGYYNEYFERSLRVIMKLTGAPTPSNHSSDGINVFESMFHFYLSGVSAQPDQRADFLRSLLIDESEFAQSFAMAGIAAMLKCDHFSSSYGFEFGARKSNYGFHPRGREGLRNWFDIALSLCREAEAITAFKIQARSIFSDAFGGLIRIGLVDEPIELADHFRLNGGWPEGWASVRQGIGRLSEVKRDNDAKKLRELSDRLKPETLSDRIKSFALPEDFSVFDLGEFEHSDPKRAQKARLSADGKCIQIGQELASDNELLIKYISLLTNSKSRRVSLIIKTIAENAIDPHISWRVVLDAIPPEPTQAAYFSLAAFVSGLANRDASIAESVMDQAFRDSRLHPYLVQMQAAAGLSRSGLDRLRSALPIVTIPTTTFSCLAYGSVTDVLSGKDYFELVTGIAERDEEGIHIAIDIMHMRIHSARYEKALEPDHIETGKFLLERVEFSRNNRQRDERDLSHIAEVCLTSDSLSEVRSICERLSKAFQEHKINSHDYGDLVSVLSEKCAHVVLTSYSKEIWILLKHHVVFSADSVVSVIRARLRKSLMNTFLNGLVKSQSVDLICLLR